uniref:Alpha-soluble NSF attachment protein n=1 Tax=Sexangularia sp. CB-2014 TaxID=1486929 RepID=A0A7S1VVE4_9EUKA
MSDHLTKGRIYAEKGEKKMNSWSFGVSKYEDAAELFEQSATCYKLAKEPQLAAQSYSKAASAFTKADSPNEAASALVSASNVLRKVDGPAAAAMLEQAVGVLSDGGRFSSAAKHCKVLGEIWEGEGDLGNAMEWYQQSADFYEGEGSTSAADSCLLKVAAFAVTVGDLARGIRIYEDVASRSLDNLRKWSCKEYYLRAGLAHLATDVVAARQAVARYCDADASFADTREGVLLAALVDAAEAYDVDAFTAAVVQFDSVSRLDPWFTSLLLRIKKQIAVEGGVTEAEEDEDDLT